MPVTHDLLAPGIKAMQDEIVKRMTDQRSLLGNAGSLIWDSGLVEQTQSTATFQALEAQRRRYREMLEDDLYAPGIAQALDSTGVSPGPRSIRDEIQASVDSWLNS